jgi:hypothetical protein
MASRRERPLSVMVQHRAAVKMRTAGVIPARVCQLTPARATGTAARAPAARFMRMPFFGGAKDREAQRHRPAELAGGVLDLLARPAPGGRGGGRWR